MEVRPDLKLAICESWENVLFAISTALPCTYLFGRFGVVSKSINLTLSYGAVSTSSEKHKCHALSPPAVRGHEKLHQDPRKKTALRPWFQRREEREEDSVPNTISVSSTLPPPPSVFHCCSSLERNEEGDYYHSVTREAKAEKKRGFSSSHSLPSYTLERGRGRNSKPSHLLPELARPRKGKGKVLTPLKIHLFLGRC